MCDYCEVLCEILIFSYHISVISYFLDGVHGLEHNNFFLENCHKAVFIAIISFVFLSPINGMPYVNNYVNDGLHIISRGLCTLDHSNTVLYALKCKPFLAENGTSIMHVLLRGNM